MRPLAVAVLGLALLLASGGSARACDPFWDWWCDSYDPYWDVPAYDAAWWAEPAYAEEPAAYVPPTPDPIVWDAPQTDVLDVSPAVAPVPAPDPIAFVAPPDAASEAAALGLHLVNEVFAGHVTTTSGDLTTYTSASTAYEAGTAARLVTSVATGEATAYDSVVLGGRTTLTDGRTVAGDIYENYAWSGSQWVVNAYVFFQDDSELARSAAPTPPPPVTATAAPIPVAPDPPPPAAPTPVPVAAAPDAYVAPIREPSLDVSVPPPADPRPVADAPAAVTTPRPRAVRAGMALAANADVLSRIEVLRGRRVPLWLRATVDGAPARVVGWELREGEVTILGPLSGSGDDPLVASWRTVTSQGSPFLLTARVRVEVPGEGTREVDAAIEALVRSPGIVE